MPNARIVLAQGVIDGVNCVFACGEPYVSGSVAYILNGRIHSAKSARGPENDFGFVELSPDAGTIQVDNAPVAGDVVQLFFWDRKVQPVPSVTHMAGILGADQKTTGVLREPTPERLIGVARRQTVQGVMRDITTERISGVVTTTRVVGTIRTRCP